MPRDPLEALGLTLYLVTGAGFFLTLLLATVCDWSERRLSHVSAWTLMGLVCLYFWLT